MLSPHNCVFSMASLQEENGHNQRPACLGVEHLREGVSQNPCMNCSFMPHALRLARLAEVGGSQGVTPLALVSGGTRRRTSKSGRPPMKSCKVDTLAHKVDALSTEFAEIKAVLQNLQPEHDRLATVSNPVAELPLYPEEDTLSTAVSCTLFTEEDEHGEDKVTSCTSQAFSQGSGEVQPETQCLGRAR